MNWQRSAVLMVTLNVLIGNAQLALNNAGGTRKATQIIRCRGSENNQIDVVWRQVRHLQRVLGGSDR